MMKRNFLPLLILLCIAIPTVHAANWQDVTTITGSENKDTEYYEVSATELKVTWRYLPDPGVTNLALFSFTVYQKNGLSPLATISKTGINETNGIIYVNDVQNDVLLHILAANLESYNIRIEEDTDTIPQPTTTFDPTIYIAIIAIVIVAAVAVTSLLIIRKRRKPTQALKK